MTGNPETEQALEAILEQADAEIQPFRTRQYETYWQASVHGTDEAFKAAEEAEMAYRLKLGNQELFEELGKFLSDAGVQDIRLRRWAQVLRLEMAPHRLPEEVIANLVSREKKLEANVIAFRPEIDGERVTANRIAEILRTSGDMELRRAAWEASKELGPLLADELRELVRARNLAARSVGFPDYYRMNLELQEIDEARLFSSLGRFASLSEEAFRRMKARLDRLLADRFGIEAIDLEPWHYGDPFFQEVPPVFGVDADPIFAAHSTLEWVKTYFAGIGLPIEPILEKGDYFEREGKDPHAFCLDVNREGEVRVLLNLQDNTYWAGTALHEFGHAVYDMNIDRTLPFALRRPAHISTTEAVAMFFGRLARNLEWLAAMFKLRGKKIRELEGKLLEEQRMQMAITGRWTLVMIHFERGLYRDPDQNQQNRWWDLVQRFQLIRCPKGRASAHDWATKLHIATAPVYYHNYLLGEWTASQFHDAMLRDLKLEEPEAWVDRPEIGEWFGDNVFRHGSLWEFNELVRNATGGIPQPDSFVNQFLR